ncbi:MAG: DUF4340 domain-containing protein [Candidatus Eisenbacteria bacterium]|nr:DUF4340 domain-containing protein [Candidatus Eisenbacteria bacterium]
MRGRPPTASQIVLALLLVVLVALLLRREDRTGSPTESAVLEGGAFDPSVVTEVLFQRRGERIRVVRESDGFWIVQPYRDRADDRFLAQSIKVAATMSPLRILPDTSSEPFGLHRPIARWSCLWPGGSYTILLGDSLPASGGRFARAGGDPRIRVVDPFLSMRYLAPPKDDIHAPEATSIEVGPLDSLEVVTREERIRIIRRRADRWEIVSPLLAEGSAVTIGRAVAALRSEKLQSILGPTGEVDLAAAGLDPPRATWTLHQGRLHQSVRIGHPTKDQRSVFVIPAGRDVVAMIDSESFRPWVDGLKLLREPLLLDVAYDSLQAVRIEGGSLSRLFHRLPAGDWAEIAGKETLAVRSEGFGRMARNTCQIRAIAFHSGPPPRTLPGEIAILLAGGGGGVDTLRLGHDGGETAVAVSRRQPTACGIPSEVYRLWLAWIRSPVRP